MNSKLGLLTAAAFLLCSAMPASAEIVFLKSGRTLSVSGHSIDGDAITLTLRSGGPVTFDRSLVDRIEPDEVPYIDPNKTPDPEPVVQTPASPVRDGSLLETTPYGEIISSVAA